MRRGERQGGDELCPSDGCGGVRGGLGKGEFAVVSAEDFAGEAEAKADAVGAIAAARGIAAEETFEDAWAVVGGNARAGVGDGDECVGCGGGEREAHATVGVVILEGVGGEILERLLEEDGVGGNRDVRWHDGVEVKVGCEGGAVFDDVGEECAEPNDSADAADGLDQRIIAAFGAREFAAKALDVDIDEVGAGSTWSFQTCSQILRRPNRDGSRSAIRRRGED